MNVNTVTGVRLTPALLDALRAATPIASGAPLTLKPTDAPYYFARINPRARLRDQHIADPYSSYTVTSPAWMSVVVTDAPDRAELAWLVSVGLAMPYGRTSDLTGSTFAVNPLAIRELYDAATGAFIGVDIDKDKKAVRVVKLLQTYVLPGMFWRNYYVTDRLAKHIALTQTLGEEMLEIKSAWDKLVAQFGFLGEE